MKYIIRNLDTSAEFELDPFTMPPTVLLRHVSGSDYEVSSSRSVAVAAGELVWLVHEASGNQWHVKMDNAITFEPGARIRLPA